jgi:hypothetical protein
VVVVVVVAVQILEMVAVQAVIVHQLLQFQQEWP